MYSRGEWSRVIEPHVNMGLVNCNAAPHTLKYWIDPATGTTVSGRTNNVMPAAEPAVGP